MRIKNLSSPPGIPVAWVSPKGTKVWWKTTTEPFQEWMNRVFQYCDGNGVERPTEQQLHDTACAVFPGWACEGGRNPNNLGIRKMGGVEGQVHVRRCGGCGR
jgi:hypothetical protein